MPEKKDMKVLMVDDSNMTRKMITNMLVSLGYENVVGAKDGLDAIDKLKENEDVGLVVSDWNMPRMDGLTFLKWFRAEDKFKQVPFIMATAQGDKKQINMAMEEGANDVIPKPFPPDELQAKIDQVMSGEKRAEGPTVIVKRDINKSPDGKVKLKMAHIQITDHLALGALKHLIEKGEYEPKYFELETKKMPGWNPVQDAVEKAEVDGAFVLAPIAMDLFGYNVPIKLVMLAHKDGSVMVRNKKLMHPGLENPADFYKWKAVLIPHKMSVHNMLAHRFLKDHGLRPGVPGSKQAINVRFEVVPPVQMPTFMAESENVAAFIVAEPLGSKAVATGIADREFLSGEQWGGHPCCVVAMRDELVGREPDAVHEFCDMLVKAGKYIGDNPDEAAKIAVDFLDPEKKLGLQVPVLHKVLTEDNGIRTVDLLPILEDLDKIQRYMYNDMEIGELIDVEKFVDLQFAKDVCK